MFRLSTQEGQRLTTAMLAMRPDWTPNKPGVMLAAINENEGLPGKDFGHALRALAHYATAQSDDGRHQYRTPDIYPRDGKHWTTTAPENWTKPKPPPCQVHIGEDGPTCRCCIADVKLGDRPANMIGKHWQPDPEANIGQSN